MSGAPGAEQARPWPRLRDELRLHPGPASRWGAPTWTLHDPAGQRFFRIGWLEMEILRRWDLGNPAAIAEAVAQETTLAPTPETVVATARFLAANNLTDALGPEATAALVKQRRARNKGILTTVLHNYLFLRIPLWRPDDFLAATLKWVQWLFSRGFALVMAALATLGLYLVAREWALFRDTLSGLLTLEGGLWAAAALGLSKCVHELGHAYAAKRLGLRVPTMGVALMCFAPVLWTDTTEAWKLPRRRDRLGIGAAGVAAELLLATLAAIAWPLLPEGPLKTACFMLAGSVWILTLTVNVNPCMRYDGYYLLSDYWDVPGLQQRAFALAKWFVRERLFGFGRPPPEPWSRRERAWLIAYALCTWVYRFFLFLGIALMVYYLFFKALGVVLMLVELAFFLALPIVKEVGVWIESRKEMRLNYRTVRTALVFLTLLCFLVVPWHNRVGGAAVIAPARRAGLYAPAGALVEAVTAGNWDEVHAGDVLIRLRSPDLDARIAVAQAKVDSQRARLSLASLDRTLRIELAADWDELEQRAADLTGLLRERDTLDIRAPFDGVLVDMPDWLIPGSWVQEREPLALLAGGGRQVQVFVPEHARARVRPGGVGTFYPQGKGMATVRLRIVSVEEQAVREIAFPELGSPYGGPLGAYRTESGRLEPEGSVYRVVCAVEGDAPAQVLVGRAALEAHPRSLATDIWRRFLGLLVRESGL